MSSNVFMGNICNQIFSFLSFLIFVQYYKKLNLSTEKYLTKGTVLRFKLLNKAFWVRFGYKLGKLLFIL